MQRPNRGCIVFLLAGMLGVAGGTAWADDAAKPASEAPMAAPRKFTGDQQAFFIAGSVSDSPTWTIGTTLPAGVTVSVGLNLNYNSNGLPAPAGAPPGTPPSTDKVAFSGVLYGAYYIYNKFPVGIAVEAAVVEPISPTAGSPATTVVPGIGILYAPFPAPIVLGSGLDVQISFIKGGGTVVQTVTPGLRIVYVF
jgi:hypothetical protein